MHFLLEERTDRPGTKTWPSQVIGFRSRISRTQSTVKGVLAEKKCAGCQEDSRHAATLHGRLAGAKVGGFGYARYK